jgi:hypothetical protein
MAHPSDPVETPIPRAVTDRHGRERDGGYADADGPVPHECLHLELIDDVRQARKRRLPLTVAVITISATLILTVAAVLYGQGQAAGAADVRLDALEQRAAEDRSDGLRESERQRQDATDAAQRDTQFLQTLHALDSRLGRIEERLSR